MEHNTWSREPDPQRVGNFPGSRDYTIAPQEPHHTTPYTHTYSHSDNHLHVHTHTHARMCMHTQSLVHTYTQPLANTHIHTVTHTCTHTHTHTYTHMYIFKVLQFSKRTCTCMARNFTTKTMYIAHIHATLVLLLSL